MENTAKSYKLLGSDGKFYKSDILGLVGGHKKLKIYGRLDCPSALRYIAKGKYVKHRVFFLDEETEVIEFSTNLNFFEFDYQILEDKKINYLQTRNEKRIKNFIYNHLKKINDFDKLNFLYLECFNKKAINPLKEIYFELEHNFENVYVKIYKILKTTLVKR